MLVDFDSVFKRVPNKAQYDRIVERLISEKSCGMCESARVEEDYEHGYKTFHTICGITNMLRDGETGEDCPYWAPTR